MNVEIKSKVSQVFKSPLDVSKPLKIDSFIKVFEENVKNAKKIWIAVAFITINQLENLWSLFKNLKIKEVKILTSTYNHFNDPKVLEVLFRVKFENLMIKMRTHNFLINYVLFSK